MTSSARPAIRLLLALSTLAWAAVLQAQPTALNGADWELHALGVTTAQRLSELRAAATVRPVTLAIVGQGGVSKRLLGPVIGDWNTLEYRQWPEGHEPDPGANTHDTQAARVILDLTLKLGIKVRLLVFHAGESWSSVAEAFARAGAEADIVALYQSFWGDVSGMARSIAEAPGALFISPYVEVGAADTSTCLQAHAAKPWAEGLPHFVTTVPLARRAPAVLLTPLIRPTSAGSSSAIFGSRRCVDRGCPSTLQTRRSDTTPWPRVSRTCSIARRRLAGLSNSPKLLPSGSRCPAPDRQPLS